MRSFKSFSFLRFLTLVCLAGFAFLAAITVFPSEARSNIMQPCAPATSSVIGCVKPDNTSITVAAGGILSALSSATPFLVGNSGANSVALSTTAYLRPLGENTTLNQAQYVAPRAGTLQNLFIVTLSGQSATGAMVCAVTVNSATPGAITITVAAGDAAEMKSDTTHTIPVARGDLVAIQCANAATAVSANIGAWSLGLI
jgi:prophage DNA circulation protein